MSRRLYVPIFAVIIAACSRELPTIPAFGSEPLLAKPWSGQSVSLASGVVAAPFAVNNDSRSSSMVNLNSVADYTASIALSATSTSALSSACETVGDATVANSLLPYLTDGLRIRTRFIGQVNLSAIGAANVNHKLAVFWVDGPNSYYLTIGATSQSDLTFPGEYPTVSQAGSVYSYSGGTVTMRLNYNKSKNASLVCRNLDAIEMSYPVP